MHQSYEFLLLSILCQEFEENVNQTKFASTHFLSLVLHYLTNLRFSDFRPLLGFEKWKCTPQWWQCATSFERANSFPSGNSSWHDVFLFLGSSSFFNVLSLDISEMVSCYEHEMKKSLRKKDFYGISLQYLTFRDILENFVCQNSIKHPLWSL